MDARAKRAVSNEQAELLRQIPSVDELLAQPQLAALATRVGRGLLVEITRAVLADLRARIAGEMASAVLAEFAAHVSDPASLEETISTLVERILARSLQPVINATGVVLHTNLGRAPLPEGVVDEFRRAATQYSNLEYDLEADGRGVRDRGEQLRRRGSGDACGAGARRRGDCLARRADRNWRRLSNPGNHGAERRDSPRSRHDQSDAPRGLRRRHKRKDAPFAARASFEFQGDGIHRQA